MATNITDLKKARELVNSAAHLLADAKMNLDETLQNLDWAELDIIKYTKAIAEDMGLIDGSCTYDEYIELCKEILLKTPISLEDITIEEVTIEEFVDLLYWQSILSLVKQKKINDPLDCYNYISKFAPGLRTKFYRLKMQTICDLTTELGIKHLIPIQKETQND